MQSPPTSAADSLRLRKKVAPTLVALAAAVGLAATPVSAAPTVTKYGREWSPTEHPLTVELFCYRHNVTREQGGLGKAGHFREVVNLMWGPHNTRKRFIWHPWADKMLEESCVWKYLAISGCASSGKTDFCAIYAIVNWLSDPMNTMVLVTSTSLKESRGRIWGSIEDYWNAAQHVFGDALPGRLVSSVGLIRLEDPSGQFKTSDRCGIHLIAGEKKKEKDTIGKLIGLKAHSVILLADELAELSPALIEAATSNLDSNPLFQMIGPSNPNSIYDPHGDLSKPKGGWKSVTPLDDEWETTRGYHIRFDAEKSPNILAERTIYPWLPTKAQLDKKKAELGDESLAYWRMWRAFWCPNGSSENVVSEADIIKFDCEKTEVKWMTTKPPTAVAFLDPGFTNGGDRSALYFGLFGNDEAGLQTLLWTDHELLFEDATKNDQPRNFQIAEQFRDKCLGHKPPVFPQCAAFDATGAGGPFGDIVQTVWSRAVTRTEFGGKASEVPSSAHDRTPACDKYANRVTEIWYSVKEYMRGGQIKGIGADLGLELTARRVRTKKEGMLKMQVEPKPDMRARTGHSPDIADAALGILDFLRSKFRFRAEARTVQNTVTKKNWKQFRMRVDTQMEHLDRAA